MYVRRFYIKNGILEHYTKKEEVVIVPEGIHTIGEGAFKGYFTVTQNIRRYWNFFDLF